MDLPLNKLQRLIWNKQKTNKKGQTSNRILDDSEMNVSGLNLTTYIRTCPRGVMVKAMNCGIVVREFVLQSRYYVHFRANTRGKGMNPLILPPAMGK